MTGTGPGPTSGLGDAAEAAVAEVLAAVAGHHPAVIVSAPPGSGKTGLVERVAACATLLDGCRVAVATPTVAQAFDVARRTAAAYPQLPVTVFARAGFDPDSFGPRPANLAIVTRTADLPGDGVVLATAAKWAAAGDPGPFDLLVVDEAYQLTDAAFAQVAWLAGRYVMVGDPGQIAPVVKIDTRRWRGQADGPHLAAPVALLARRPDAVTHIRLPATRRLPADTVELIAEPFYPELPFGSLRVDTGIRAAGGLFGAAAASGQTLVHAELPGGGGSVADPGIAAALVELVHDAVTGTEIETAGGWRAVTTADVAVVCAHINQVTAVQAALAAVGTTGVLCDTSERIQGLERPLVFVWHPLAGHADPSAFALNAGRWCVMLSRHTHLAVVVSRQGTSDILAQAGAAGERILGEPTTDTYRGWRSHVELADALAANARIVDLAEPVRDTHPSGSHP